VIEHEGLLDDLERAFLGERVEPRLIHGGGGHSAFDGAKDEEGFVEAGIDPFDHVGIGEAPENEGFTALVVVGDLQTFA
jgi:hypothetical protein